MKNGRKGIIALIILLAVGFAAVTATLVINGTSLFGANNDDFDVIFTKAIIDGVENNTVISEDGKSITYETKELAIKDEESILDFTVKNNSTQYDAEVSIECIGGGSVGTYYEIEKNVAAYIPAQTEDVGKVIVRMIKSSTEPIEEQFTCTITATAVERENAAEIVPEVCEPVTTCNEAGDVCWTDTDCSGIKDIADVVTLGTNSTSIEQFYILNSDEDNTEMMSTYNLYVGGVYDSSTSTWTAYENPTGIQDSTMIGYNAVDTSIRRGTTTFSSTSTDYTESLVEGYVNNYRDYLINTLGVENTATLISKEELEEIVGQTLSAGDHLSTMGAPAFLYSTSYWTRSAYDSNSVWYINTASGFGYTEYYHDIDFGVRPVITIDNEVFTREIPSEPETQITYEDTDGSGTRNIGDIITLSKEGVSSEQFYVLSDDGTNLQLMSMYNLYVGGDYTTGWTAYTNPTGIQDSTMLGWNAADTSIRRGVTVFSSDSQKGTDYSDYEGSIVEGYVNNYRDYISNTLGVENIATLISKEELETIAGQTLNNGDLLKELGAPDFLYSMSYWTRSSYDTSVVWCVGSAGDFLTRAYSYVSGSGVRPVITISSSLVN